MRGRLTNGCSRRRPAGGAADPDSLILEQSRTVRPLGANSGSVVPIGIERLTQFRRADDLRGDIVPAVHHVQVHVAIEAFQWMIDE